MPKKKILIRIGSLRHGGAEKVLVTFLKKLPEDKYDIDLLLNLYSGKYLTEIPSWINVLYLNKGEMIITNRLQDIPIKIYRVLYQKLLKKHPKLLYKYVLKNKSYDIEFAAIHGFLEEMISSPLPHSKKLVWIHNDLSQVKEFDNERIKKFFQFDKIMVISEKIQSLFETLAENETDKNKIVRIYNPIDTKEIIEKSTLNIQNKENVNIPNFVSVGTVFPQKGFDRLIKVHHKLLKEGLKHSITIVGDGYDFDNIKTLRDSLSLQNTVKMIGFHSNPYPFFTQADYYILSSRYEGFPTVLFEAMVLKKNIIATQVSGVKEMLQNGDLGLIVDNSEDGIYKGMKQALENPESFFNYQEKLTNFNFPFELNQSVTHIQNIIDEL